MSDTWRLIESGPVDGELNMAIDRAVQLERERGASPPTLRLYTWARPTVTLGRFQSESGVDMSAVERYDLDVTRRFTGGRGVLHDHELTYSVVASRPDGIPRGVAASYRHLCGALVEAYRSLGVQAELTARPRGTRGSAACYLHSTQADVSVGVAKLSGSAQVWAGDTVLQHGSFVISRDVERESAVFGLDSQAAQDLASSTVTLADSVGEGIDVNAIRDAVVAGFECALGITLHEGELTATERALAETLIPEVRVSVL